MRALSSAVALAAALLALCSCVGLTRTGGGGEAGSLQSVQHIVYMVQENRTFDHYFGQLGQYREANNLGAASDIDGLPSWAWNAADNGTILHPFHLATTCVEEFSDDWMESHIDMNENHAGSSTILLDGFVHISGAYALFFGESDTLGVRAMGYYDQN